MATSSSCRKGSHSGSSMGTPEVNNHAEKTPRISVLKGAGAKGRASPAAQAACPPQLGKYRGRGAACRQQRTPHPGDKVTSQLHSVVTAPIGTGVQSPDCRR